MTQNTLWQPSDISNNEGGNDGAEQDSPKRRGRIPQSAWPQILERYRAGATLSAIAREFECTPSAISYIVRKAEAAGKVGGEDGDNPATPPAAAAPATEATAESPAEAPAAVTAPAAAPAPSAQAPSAQAPAVQAPAAPSPAQAAAPAAPAAAPPPAAEAPKAAAAPQPAPRRSLAAAAPATEAPKPAAEPTKTRLELKREEPARPAAPPPAQAAAPAAPVAAPAAEATAAPRPASPGTGPTPPVDEVEARLRETARGCLAAYRAWRQQPGQGSIQTLSDAVHDLRKVLARIEIDMSASRRDEQVARPIPIPAHRAARRSQ